MYGTYIVPSTTETYPEEIQESARSTALLEMQWRLQDYVGRPMSPGQEQGMHGHARAALGRYLDILADYWWAVYTDPMSHTIVASIITDAAYHKEPNLAVRARFQRVADAGR